MKLKDNVKKTYLTMLALIALALTAPLAVAEDRAALDADVHAAIKMLLDTSPAAKALAPNARGAHRLRRDHR